MFGAATGGTLHRPTEFTETVGLFASFFVWTVFGAHFVGPVLTTRIDATAVAYAVLSLTVIRMVPVANHAPGTPAFDGIPSRSWGGSAPAGWPRSCSRSWRSKP